MDEADAEIELRIASQTLFEARHADQYQPDPSLIENAPDVFEARHLEPVGFVNDQ